MTFSDPSKSLYMAVMMCDEDQFYYPQQADAEHDEPIQLTLYLKFLVEQQNADLSFKGMGFFSD